MRRPELVPLARSSRRRRSRARRRGRRPARRCRRAGSTPRSGRSSGSARESRPRRRRCRTGFRSSCTGMCPYGISPFAIRCGADHAGEADVDHAPLRLDVQPDAEAGEEDACGREQPHRPDRRATSAAARSRRAIQTQRPSRYDERRIGERRAPEDLALVEEPQRDREREQREQVEVPQRERPAQVGEPERGRRAQKLSQSQTLLIVLPPKAPGAAACHRPGDLRPGPRLRHLAGAVVDLAEHDLARLARPGLHDPLVRSRAVLGVRLRLRRVAVEPVGDLRGGRGSRSPAPRSGARRPRPETKGVSTRRPSASKTGSARRRGRRPGERERRQRDG